MESHLSQPWPYGARIANVVRVSEVGDRSGPSFSSPAVQRRQSLEWAARHQAEIVDVHEELNVSGGLPLSKRIGLRRAVEMVERGEADIVLFAFFDRSFRDVAVQFQTLDRIESAGGQLWSVDFGRITAETAAQWAAQAYMGVNNEMMRRQTAEKVKKAHREAVERGVPPFGRIVRGYRRGADGRLVVEQTEAPLITEVFRRRANGVTLRACQQYLAEHGVRLSYSSMKALFRSRIPLGEIHAGKFVNLNAHPALVDAVTWQRVQRQTERRGRPPVDAETRLMVKLGILRCGNCHTAMSATLTVDSSGRKYRQFRCGRRPDCRQPAAISESLLEQVVVERWKAEYGKRLGAASLDAQVGAAEAELTRAQAQYEAFLDTFGDDLDLARVREKRAELRKALDAAVDMVSRVRAAAGPSEVLLAGRDWDRLTTDERRDLLRAAYAAIEVAPTTTRFGNPLERARTRVSFEPLAQ